MLDTVCAITGPVVKPRMARWRAYDGPVTLNYRKILAENVAALRNRNPELGSARKIAKACPVYGKRRIGPRTITHLLETGPAAPQPQLDTIVAVAEVFRVAPWMLMHPDFDADKRTVGDLPAPEIIALARRLASIGKDALQLLGDALSNSVPDGEVEAAGYDRRGAHALHEREPSPYEKGPRQMKIKMQRE